MVIGAIAAVAAIVSIPGFEPFSRWRSSLREAATQTTSPAEPPAEATPAPPPENLSPKQVSSGGRAECAGPPLVRTVSFHGGAFVLSSADAEAVDRIADQLDRSKGVTISGHADVELTDQAAMQLSEKRARRVAARFVGKAWSPDQTTVWAFGNMAPPTQPDASAGNRRVVISGCLPAPPQPVVPVQPATKSPAPEPAPAAAPVTPRPPLNVTDRCLVYTGSDWRMSGASTSINQCLDALYAGRCARPGQAFYGRWGSYTLRLVPGRVEYSGDNQRFHMWKEVPGACDPLFF